MPNSQSTWWIGLDCLHMYGNDSFAEMVLCWLVLMMEIHPFGFPVIVTVSNHSFPEHL